MKVAVIWHRGGGEIRNPLSSIDVSDTAFGGGHVSASTLGIQGEREGMK